METENIVWKVAKIRMSQKSLSAFLFAVIETHARIKETFYIGENYPSVQADKSRWWVDIIFSVSADQFEKFKELSKAEMTDPIKVHTN